MLLSELVAALGKVNQLAGDIPVELYHLESEAKTALLSIGVHIDPTTGSTGGAITLEHGPTPTPAAAPVGEPQPNQA